jgi:hypothetical protein
VLEELAPEVPEDSRSIESLLELQDAYACSGQKCSAQSILFMHSNWSDSGLLDKMKALAGRWVAPPAALLPV